MSKYYTVELTEKQLDHINDALDFYQQSLSALQIHNATIKALENHEVSSRRKMLQAIERKLVNRFEREQLRKENEND